jgi:ATPase subunit of ABC transporter with duplicated ATPase domains
MQPNSLISTSSLSIKTPDGRQIVDQLNMQLGCEKVAIIGRNGVGKSTLIKALTEQEKACCVQRTDDYYCVYQSMDSNQFNPLSVAKDDVLQRFSMFNEKLVFKEFGKIGLAPVLHKQAFSQGELRKLNLVFAKLNDSELLLLDEPTIDLDEQGKTWLLDWLCNWRGGLIVATHDQQLQAIFKDFFILAESGCHYVSGSYEDVYNALAQQQLDQQIKYLSNLNDLLEQEKRADKLKKRWQQKKNQGRLRELRRMTPKVRLNTKRSRAQENQGRVAGIRKDRIDTLTDMVKRARRQLQVSLPLTVFMPTFLEDKDEVFIELQDVTLAPFFHHLCFSVGRQRLAVVGANGAGKTTLIELMLRQRQADAGRVIAKLERIGYIAQGASNWQLYMSLLEYLLRHSKQRPLSELMQIVVAHRFPLGLAERPMISLSPGERLRAALICLFSCGNGQTINGENSIECLVLDEPTVSLDSLALGELRDILNLWQGGLVVVSHDQSFLCDIGISRQIQLNQGFRLNSVTT